MSNSNRSHIREKIKTLSQKPFFSILLIVDYVQISLVKSD